METGQHDIHADGAQEDVQFWRISRVEAAVGMKKSTIYREISMGKFPPSRRYPAIQGAFWTSVEVRAWQQAVIEATGVRLDGLLG